MSSGRTHNQQIQEILNTTIIKIFCFVVVLLVLQKKRDDIKWDKQFLK